MSIRTWIQRHSKISVVLTVVSVAGAIGLALASTSRSGQAVPLTQSYFTVDDGATYFAAANTNVPPFQCGGKEAVSADVYRCSKSGKVFVYQLRRFKPNVKTMVEKAISEGKTLDDLGPALMGGVETKKPGSGHEWTVQGVGLPTCLGNPSEAVQIVMPE